MLKKHDFVEIDFTTIVKSTNKIVDSTIEKVGKSANLSKEAYKPQTICLGEGMFMEQVEEKLIGKPLNKEVIIDLTPEQAFGNRDAAKISTISLPKFTKEKINPFPGLVVNVDGKIGTVKSVSGGRVRVDFNHPLAGKELIYKVTPLKKLEKTEEKVKILLSQGLGIPDSVLDIKFKEGIATIGLPQPLNESIEKIIEEKVKSLVPEVKNLKFLNKQPLKNN
tara:strand:+ start:3241 stop:3906 length:666 start_codon:yes stop_codon:yes gene_type:complete